MFTTQDLAQIRAHGLTAQQAEQQMEYFRDGFPYLNINRAAIVGDGIRQLSREQIQTYTQRYAELSLGKKVVKFVPASGAATRMFKTLFESLERKSLTAGAEEVIGQLDRFAFAEKLRALRLDTSDPLALLQGIVGPSGLDYGHLPKALILFHRYREGNRTALEEHLSEGAGYTLDQQGVARIHFTVSPEHLPLFKARIETVLPLFQMRYNAHFEISYSGQKPGTDTVAANPDNTPFRESDGALLFRPAGHGALIENLNEIDAEVIYIKTVDNVLPDPLKADTITYKRALGGLLLTLQQRIHSYLRSLYNRVNDPSLTQEAARFVEEKLGYRLSPSFRKLSTLQQADLLYKLLDRPLRVCGMVRNEGEPGGGPFWVAYPDGSESLQIAESSQIAPGQQELMRRATHFNPVDLVCATHNYRGESFDLRRFVDPSTGFISNKSKDGRELRAQELPGLWNGAMAGWNTVFVEVPITTFAPVKVIGDLLRPQHQND